MHKFITAVVALLVWSLAARAQEAVHFPSLDGATQLDGYLYRPAGEGRRLSACMAAAACSAEPPEPLRQSTANGPPS
jgi:hypothetical protein